MTEQEAKTKWCPFVRVTRETDTCFAATNRGEIETTAKLDFKCIGSACMAWRPIMARAHEHGNLNPTGHGFCGLAGKP